MIKERPRHRERAWTRDLCSRGGAGAGGGLLECQELLRAEGLVVDLGGRLNEVLQVSSEVVISECQTSELKGTNLKRKSRRYTNSQCLSSSTFTTPQRFLRPRTGLPSMITLRSEPTTAKGIMLCEDIDQKGFLIKGVKCDIRGSYRSEPTLLRRSHRYRKGTGGCCGGRVPRGSTKPVSTAFQGKRASKRTLLLKASLSSGVKESDLAMTGTTLTTSDNFFITIMSMGRREWPVKHQSNPRSP